MSGFQNILSDKICNGITILFYSLHQEWSKKLKKYNISTINTKLNYLYFILLKKSQIIKGLNK